jgi:hypothetical protein
MPKRQSPSKTDATNSSTNDDSDNNNSQLTEEIFAFSEKDGAGSGTVSPRGNTSLMACAQNYQQVSV